MKLKELLIFSLFFSLSSIVIGQANKIENFTYLKSSGEIPKEFLTLTSEKYKNDFENNDNKELDKDFFLSTRFVIDEILLSGNVLFNEELSDYVSKIAKYLLRKDKKLRNSLQFYVLKSNSVNAFSTDQGIIFVTTGLIAQIENEAQLAYILAHEIAHFTEHHVRDGYVERQNIARGRGQYRKLSYESKVSELSTYSKENEFIADEKGIELFLGTEYDIETVYTAFEVLLYSYLPFEDVQFDTAFFNTDYLFVPGNAFPDTIKEISQIDDFDDRLSSHPNIQKRIDAALDIIGDKKTRGDLKFKQSEELFNTVRNLARFESINQYLSDRKYVDAIYRIFLLQRDFSDNKFLEFSLTKALYGLAKYKNHQRYNEVILKPKKVEGEMYKLAIFFKKIKKEQLNVLAYRHIYDLSQKYSTDKLIKKYERDMLKELALFSKLKPDDLLGIDSKSYNDSIQSIVQSFNIQDSIQKVEDSDLSKYRKIKLKKALRKLEDNGGDGLTSDSYHLTGLSDIVAKGKIKGEMEYFIASEELTENSNESDTKKKKNAGLGIKKIVVVNPYLAEYNTKNDKRSVKSEKEKIELNKMYSREYNKLDLKIDLIDSKSLIKKDVDKYNDIGLLYKWLSEELEHEDIEMLCSTNESMQLLKEKYNTSHFLFSGFLKYKERNQFSAKHLYGIIFVYTAPLAIADLLIIHNYFENYSIVVNSDTDKIEYVKIEEVKLKARSLVMEAYVYNMLYHLNTPK